MNWQDYEALGHLELKGQLVEFITTRVKEVREMEQSSEYDYCEIQGRVKELAELTKFIESIKKIKL
jgi:hypothetical protein